jgi:hypothetical protein
MTVSLGLAAVLLKYVLKMNRRMLLLILWKCDNGVDGDNYLYEQLIGGKLNWYVLYSVTVYLLQTHVLRNLYYRIWLVSVKRIYKMLLKLCVIEGICLSYSGDIFPSAEMAEVPFPPKFYILLFWIFNL